MNLADRLDKAFTLAEQLYNGSTIDALEFDGLPQVFMVRILLVQVGKRLVTDRQGADFYTRSELKAISVLYKAVDR